ncbi:LysR substrate-binding domain-containing protein [Cupriavidus basilensis]
MRESLQKLQRDTLDIMAHEGAGGIVELACVPTLAVEWLIPRLPAFDAQHPQVVVNFSAQADVFPFDGTPYDAAIHYGEANYPGGAPIPCSTRNPCRSAIRTSSPARRRSAQSGSRKAPLLHLSTRRLDWKNWMEAAGASDVNAMRGTRYDHHSMVISAARARLGVGLVPRFLVEEYLALGLLVMPAAQAMRSQRAYYLVVPPDRGP